MANNAYNLHQASLHTQLAKLQQQHLAALQQARQRRTSQPIHGGLARPHGQTHGSHNLPSHGSHGSLNHGYGGFSAAQSTGVSANPSPASSDSEDDDEPMPHPNFELHGHGHEHPAVTHGMNKMSLFHHRTAPTSAVTSPIHSRGPSRAGSPVEGHSANSGKHGLGSHQARDAKHRSHPYGHSVHGHGHAHYSVPSSPHVLPTQSQQKSRMSPGHDLARSLSGGGGLPRQSVEDILNSSAIPPPPSHSDRMLPPPNSTSSFNSTAPSLSYSLSSSPNHSRASSPIHSTHGHGHGHGHGHQHHSSNLAHSVRNAFGMTPISATSSSTGTSTPNKGNLSPPTQVGSSKLAPMSMGYHGLGHGHGGSIGVGLGHSQHNLHQQQPQASQSQSRGGSPVHGHSGGGGGGGHGGMKMEVDGQA
jgi:zinc finger protein CreA/MIG